MAKLVAGFLAFAFGVSLIGQQPPAPTFRSTVDAVVVDIRVVDQNQSHTTTSTDPRLARVEQWLKAVDGHEPGEQDEAVAEVGAWTDSDLRELWVDVNALFQLMRNPGRGWFDIHGRGQRDTTVIVYTASQLRQLRAFACAAAAMLPHPDCLAIHAAAELDADLQRLVEHAAAERARSGDDNYVVRRAALLHADIAMFQPHAPVEPFASPSAPGVGPQTWRVDILDGRGLDAGLSALHWDIAQLALDQVRPVGWNTPAPEHDPMVRAWYRATAAWMQYRQDDDTFHLDHARKLFPNDPHLLFLSGCQRETDAGPAVQSAARSIVLPAGFTMGVASERGELRQAEAFFRRALAQQPDLAEARLRLGRVVGQQGRHMDAAGELRQALELIEDDALRYYGELFLGAEEEALGRFPEARAAYEQAAALYPSAQSPLVALSELARRRGDRAGSLAAIQKVFVRPEAPDGGRDDPWWDYHIAQAKNADELLDAVRAPFRRRAP
jgi:tetratricopeptide (TPR) repeat protein